jgi:threonine/homoserine/homoserine lactone efflux protein
MDPALSSATIINGLILGWSVAWPPGPINAEIIRRCSLPPAEGGGFWPGFVVGLGACGGDFLWAFGVSTGAGALINTPRVRLVLAALSFVLLLVLAVMFARGAWRIARDHRTGTAPPPSAQIAKRGRSIAQGLLLGFAFVLTSPWNVAFWLAVIGGQSGTVAPSLSHSLVLAASVVLGALAWGCVLCGAVKLGASIFARPSWQIATQALSAVVMLYFAARLAAQFI